MPSSLDYEKIVRKQVLRKVRAEHPFFEDLCQEGHIAVLEVVDKLDKKMSKHAQKAFLSKAVYWRVTKAWQVWLRGSLMVSVKSMREARADFFKIKNIDLEKIKDKEELPENQADERSQINKAYQAIADSVQSEKDLKALLGFLEGVDSRTLGKRMGLSHQGVINIQKRLFARAREHLNKNAKKADSDRSGD